MCRENNRPEKSAAFHKELIMSREDDFDDIMDSPDDMDAGQDDTSEPLLDDESLDESDETQSGTSAIIDIDTGEEEEVPPPPRPPRKPAPKKKKKAAVKPSAEKPKTKPKKKAAKPAKKPAAKKKTAKKAPPARKKKAARKKR